MVYLTPNLEKFKIPIALSLVGIVLIAGGMVVSGHKSSLSKIEYPKESLSNANEISVDVSGSVIAPGVYQLSANSRVEDAIKAAGGFAASASAEYISKNLNLAQKITDGVKIYVPGKEDPTSPAGYAGLGVVAGVSNAKQINVNSATQAELEALPGIGPVTASKIISDRPFQTIDELINKKVVSKATYEKIKDLITL